MENRRLSPSTSAWLWRRNPAAQHFFACLSPEDKAGFINVVASAPDEETMTQQLARAIDLLQNENRDYYSL